MPSTQVALSGNRQGSLRGEGIVAILAESRYLAEDAAELVDVEYEDLPAVMDAEEALKPGAPLIHEGSIAT